MPSFPASVKSFTTKLDGAGNPINAAHVNDIQDEVNAIEAGYLNATARLNSSASTLAALSVTGGSTLAGTFQSSNSTVNTLSVSSQSTFAYRPTMPLPDAVLVYLTSTQTQGSSAASTITGWVDEAILTNSSMHSTATNPDRLTPQSTGLYRIDAQVSFLANSSGDRSVLIQDSSATQLSKTLRMASSNNPAQLQTGAIKRFDALGGWCNVVTGVSAVSTMSMSTGVGVTWFSMYKLL